MCRVSQLQLDCGLDKSYPHYRRSDELGTIVQETGTHIKPCVQRLICHGDCSQLIIDNSLPQGSISGIACSYCAIAQPCWTQALDDFLEGAKQDMQRYWHDHCDAFRNTDMKYFDRPELIEEFARETCQAASIAVRACVENRDDCLSDSTEVPSVPRLESASPSITTMDETSDIYLAAVDGQIAERMTQLLPEPECHAQDAASESVNTSTTPTSRHGSFSTSSRTRHSDRHPESCISPRRLTLPIKPGVQKKAYRRQMIRKPSHEKLHKLASDVNKAGLKEWRQKKREIALQGVRPAANMALM